MDLKNVPIFKLQYRNLVPHILDLHLIRQAKAYEINKKEFIRTVMVVLVMRAPRAVRRRVRRGLQDVAVFGYH